MLIGDRHPVSRRASVRAIPLIGLALLIVAIVWLRQSLLPTGSELLRTFDPSPIIFIPAAAESAGFAGISPGGSLELDTGGVKFHLRPAAVDGDAVGPAVSLHFDGATAATTLLPGAPLPGVVNRYAGNDPEAWQTGLAAYDAVTYRDLHPGIDLIYSGQDGFLKGDYIVAAGADPGLIRWHYQGAEAIAVDGASGDLRLSLADGSTLSEAAPIAWQTIAGRRVAVPVAYALAADNSVTFDLGAYDPAHPLTIDPVIVYETIYSADHLDTGRELAVDATGNAYVVGYVYPDSFIAKFNPAGDFEYLTWLSGSSLDVARNAVVDNLGYLYVSGWTGSDDFPILNAWQPAYAGRNDVFISKLDTGDGSLVFSTYLGGTRAEYGHSIALGADGAIYVTGATDSTNFPVTADAYQSTLTLIDCFCDDTFVAKLTADGQILVYSTYLGAAYTDTATDIGVDGVNNIYVHGYTESPDFPAVSAIQPNYGGGQDTFLYKLSADGQTLVYSTFLGGAQIEWPGGLAVDAAGNAVAVGRTQSTNLPTTPAAFQPQFAGGICGNPPYNPLRNCDDIYVVKVPPAGGQLTFGTYLGGQNDDSVSDVALDPAGQIHLVGHTASLDFPGNVSGLQRFILISLLTADGSDLVRTLSTWSAVYNAGHGIAVAANGDFYITGGMNAPSDVYIAKYGEGPPPPQADLNVNVAATPNPVIMGTPLTYTVTIANNGPDVAEGVFFTDTLPDDVTLLDVNAGGDACQADSGVITCDLGTLATEAARTVTIFVEVTDTGMLTNMATVNADTGDPNQGNNVMMTQVMAMLANHPTFLPLINSR